MERKFTTQQMDRIIEMAWEDRTPFEAITFQFGIVEGEVRKIMKDHLKFSSYKRWRARVENNITKHRQKRSEAITRFKSSMQRQISGNKITKR
ncbi:MAG: TIGR03643 family protein [Flavobacterium psychrophilum]|nr:MAG: TIGR03643 family protein [Flavobacterium psychrophilum]